MNLKICSICKQEKETSFFYLDKQKKDGLASHCRQCEKTKREKNKKINSIKKAKKYQENKEIISEKNKRYYQENKEMFKERNAKNYKKREKKYYEDIRKDKQYKQYQSEYYKKYLKTEIGRMSALNKTHKRRSLEKNGDIIKKHLIKILNFSLNCYWCNIKLTEKHIDHYYPLSKGGEHSIHNIVISCPKCNMEKGSKNPIDYNKKYQIFKKEHKCQQ